MPWLPGVPSNRLRRSRALWRDPRETHGAGLQGREGARVIHIKAGKIGEKLRSQEFLRKLQREVPTPITAVFASKFAP